MCRFGQLGLSFVVTPHLVVVFLSKGLTLAPGQLNVVTILSWGLFLSKKSPPHYFPTVQISFENGPGHNW